MAQKTIVPLGNCPASLGPKAAGLGAMLGLGLPVPDGFVIASAASLTQAQLRAAVAHAFGRPPVLAVRPSLYAHERGYMEAILNVGLNDETVEALARQLDDKPMAFDLYRQFIENYAVNVLGLRHADFEDIFTAHKGAGLIAGPPSGRHIGARSRLDLFHIRQPGSCFLQLKTAKSKANPTKYFPNFIFLFFLKLVIHLQTTT